MIVLCRLQGEDLEAILAHVHAAFVIENDDLGPTISIEITRRDALGIDEAMCATSRSILADYGNMSSPTVLNVLDRLRAKDAPRPWVALAFGPGLSAEGLLIR